MAAGSGVAQLFINPVQQVNGVYVNLNDQFPKHSLGEVVQFGGKTYRYVKFDNGVGNVAPSAGGPAFWMDYVTFKVTSDKTSSIIGAALGQGCAGVFLTATITDLYYTWVQIGGEHAAVRILAGDSNGAAGNKIFPQITDADADFRSEADASISAAEIPAQECGRQLAAGGSNLARVRLTIA